MRLSWLPWLRKADAFPVSAKTIGRFSFTRRVKMKREKSNLSAGTPVSVFEGSDLDCPGAPYTFLAQLVERQTEDLRVPGSIPGEPTIYGRMPESGQKGRTVNSLASVYVGSNPTSPTKTHCFTKNDRFTDLVKQPFSMKHYKFAWPASVQIPFLRYCSQIRLHVAGEDQVCIGQGSL